MLIIPCSPLSGFDRRHRHLEQGSTARRLTPPAPSNGVCFIETIDFTILATQMENFRSARKAISSYQARPPLASENYLCFILDNPTARDVREIRQKLGSRRKKKNGIACQG
jgi:hypothetical protein